MGIGLVLCATTVAVWNGQVQARHDLQHQRTLDVSVQAVRRLEVFMDSHLRVAGMFARRWASHEAEDYSRERFVNFSRVLQESYPGFHRILLRPVGGGPAWAEAGSEDLAELLALPDHQKVVEQASRQASPAISQPFPGPNGETKFFAAIPLVRDQTPQGHLLVVFRAGTLIDDCFHARIRSEFHFQISDGQRVLYRSDPGATSAWLASRSTRAAVPFSIGHRTWSLAMAPHPELRAAIGWGSDLSVPALGFSLSVGMALLAWLLMRRMHQVHSAHAATLAEVAERRRAEAARARAMDRLAQLSRKVIRAQEEERGRLARELHDELGQILTALRLELGWLEKSLATCAASSHQTREPLESVTAMVEDATRQLRLLCRGLRPPLLDDLGLEPAVRQLVEEFEAQGETYIDLSLDLPEGADRLPAEVALCAYRVLQEALTNVRRHAQAGRVDISIRSDARILELKVRDDGRGFSPEDVDASTRCGLEGMRERAKLVSGELQIDSQASAGCLVDLRIPLVATQEEV